LRRISSTARSILSTPHRALYRLGHHDIASLAERYGGAHQATYPPGFPIAIATLLFQLRLRLSTCEGFGECTSSLIKAVVWSMVWPIYWWGYLTDFTVFKLWSNPRGN